MSGGRARTIKPEILEDEKTAGLSHEAYRLFIGIILSADDFGNLRANPKLLDASVFWARETLASVSELTREIEATGLIHRYEVRGQPYIHVCGWSKHQKIDRPSKPKAPGPSEADGGCNMPESQRRVDDSRDTREGLDTHSRDTRETLALDRRGEERKGGETREGRAETPEPPAVTKAKVVDPELGTTFAAALLAAGHRVAVGNFAWKDFSAACDVYWPGSSGRERHQLLADAVARWVRESDVDSSRGWDHREFIRWANKGNFAAPIALAPSPPKPALGPRVEATPELLASLDAGIGVNMFNTKPRAG